MRSRPAPTGGKSAKDVKEVKDAAKLTGTTGVDVHGGMRVAAAAANVACRGGVVVTTGEGKIEVVPTAAAGFEAGPV